MSNEELKSRLEELHQQLEASQVNAEDRNLLGHLMSDMVNIAGGEQPGESEGDLTVTERLEQKASEFEQRHPTVAGVMRQIADLLGKMGI